MGYEQRGNKMLELLKELLDFVLQLGTSVWELLFLVLGFAMNMLILLHTEMPRLEGLVAGILLAWLMARRDRHPLLRALSAPLKMILDILDLLWDQCLDMVKDVWETLTGLVKKTYGLVKKSVTGVWSTITGGLGKLRDKLKRKSE